MHTVYRFMLWFIVSLVATLALSDIVPSRVYYAIAVSLVISFIGVKND